MKRIATSTKALNLFGAGKDGFKNGDLRNGIQPTDLDADWFNQVQEEISQFIEGSGLVLNGNVKTQLLQAVRRMTGGYVRTVTSGHTVLTADDTGLVLIDGTAGAVTISLPKANVLKAMLFNFRRIDLVGNTVTVSVSGTGADTIDMVSTSFVLTGNDACKIVSDGLSSWYSDIPASRDVGKISSFLRSTAPAGYIKANGLTIGSAASGATNRANADTWPLFYLWWNEFDNSLLHIQNSNGTPTVRGASAAADWAANKRLPTFDRRGNSSRGWDDGRGVDPGRVLGSFQDSAIQAHNHYLPTSTGTPGTTWGLTDSAAWTQSTVNAEPANNSPATTYPNAGYSDPAQVGSIGNFSGETRSANTAELKCIKL